MKLIKTPVSYGDTVYVADTDVCGGKLIKMTVTCMYVGYSVQRIFAKENLSDKESYNFRPNQIGKRVFLKLEDALAVYPELEVYNA